jgi:hypothetical protein
MTLYRLFTENKNYQGIIAQLQLRGIDATIFHCNGIWNGRAEKSICIEIFDNSNNLELWPSVEGLVYWLKKKNHQDKVLVQILEIGGELI